MANEEEKDEESCPNCGMIYDLDGRSCIKCEVCGQGMCSGDPDGSHLP